MRKNAWVICCCTAVLAAFGTFFRWLQDQVCFEAETGLAVRGSIWPYAVALMIVIAAVVLAVVCFRMKNQPHTSFPDSLPAAFVAAPRVRTIGGIYGTVTNIKDDIITISVGPDKARLVFARGAIANVEDVAVENTMEESNSK